MTQGQDMSEQRGYRRRADEQLRITNEARLTALEIAEVLHSDQLESHTKLIEAIEVHLATLVKDFLKFRYYLATAALVVFSGTDNGEHVGRSLLSLFAG